MSPSLPEADRAKPLNQQQLLDFFKQGQQQQQPPLPPQPQHQHQHGEQLRHLVKAQQELIRNQQQQLEQQDQQILQILHQARDVRGQPDIADLVPSAPPHP